MDVAITVERKILTVVKDKPYFAQGNFVLYLGDCLKVLANLPENFSSVAFHDSL